MGAILKHFFIFLLLCLLSFKMFFTIADETCRNRHEEVDPSSLSTSSFPEEIVIVHPLPAEATAGREVVMPTTTIPAINPTTTVPNYTPYNMPNDPVSTPATVTASSPGQSWCVAVPTASQTALQVALDYACGYGGADCSAIQPGGPCYNPNTVKDHASFAFNNYYQKNPIPTSCDFGGTAMITNMDPSTSTCPYPSTSTTTTVLNTTNPAGSTVFGSVPPGYSSATIAVRVPLIFMACLAISLVRVDGIQYM